MADKVAVTPDFLDGVVDVVQFAESLMSKQAALDAAIPALVDTLVENQLVSEAKKAEVIESMKDPNYLTESFAKVAGFVRPPEMGAGTTPEDKSASVSNTSKKRESDTLFEQMILGKRGGRSNW
tara:strand:- start:58 stop:429 length:372 start_codon:yes stop_codon:yes gene_type:complete